MTDHPQDDSGLLQKISKDKPTHLPRYTCEIAFIEQFHDLGLNFLGLLWGFKSKTTVHASHQSSQELDLGSDQKISQINIPKAADVWIEKHRNKVKGGPTHSSSFRRR